jgi:hypothetical protein
VELQLAQVDANDRLSHGISPPDRVLVADPFRVNKEGRTIPLSLTTILVQSGILFTITMPRCQ